MSDPTDESSVPGSGAVDLGTNASTLTRQNSLDADAQSVAEQPKRFKITASNGWQVLHKVSAPTKRVKRENSSRSLKSEGSFSGSQRTPRRGKLAELLSLPMDILFETFGHLMPMDILNLARTTKEFRRVILHKNATSLWKTVWTNPDLDDDTPPCPEDVSLPSWTNLLFSAHCHNCAAPNVRGIDWMLRTRICAKCLKPLTIAKGRFNKKDKLDKIILSCVFFEKREKDGETKRFCLTKDKEYFVKELDSLEGDRNAFIAQKTEQRKARKKHADSCRVWSNRLEKERLKTLQDAREERQASILVRLHALGYEKEFAFLEKIHGRDKTGIVPPQPDEIIPLEELDDMKLPKLLTDRSWNTRVKKVMVDYMEEVRSYLWENDRRLFVETRRKVFAECWVTWLSQKAQIKRYPPGYFMPTIVDVMDHARIKTFLNEPGERLIPVNEYMELLDKFGYYINKWRMEKSNVVWKDVLDPTCIETLGLKAQPLGMDWMEYAMMTFTCTKTGSDAHLAGHAIDAFKRPYDHKAPPMTLQDVQLGNMIDYNKLEGCTMWFPEYLHHACNKFARPHREEEWCKHNMFFQVDRFTLWYDTTLWRDVKLSRKKWDCSALKFDSKASVVVKHILEACGLPLTTKVKELDELDPRLICLKCTHGGRCDGFRRAPVRSWRNTVQHAMSTHWGSHSVRFERISCADAAIARDLEAKEYSKLNRPDGWPIPPPSSGNHMQHRLLRCLLCRDSPIEEGALCRDALCDHLERHHDMDGLAAVLSPGAEGTIYTKAMTWDQPPPQPITIQIVPKEAYSPPAAEAPTTA